MTEARRRPNWPALISIVSAILAVLILFFAVAGFFGGFFVWHPGTPPDAGRSRAAGLPAAVGVPGIRAADEAEHPVGAASMLLTGEDWFADDSDWFGAVIGAGGYRVFVNGTNPAGLGAVLSPDGRRLASGDGILDVATGRWTAYPGAWRNRELAPQAWSPDGARLAVTSRVSPEDGPYAGGATTLALLDTGTGSITRIAELDEGAIRDGWTAAFAPDGTRLAYQSRDMIFIVTLADGKSVSVPVPAGSRLAGKGAWTRDGQGLLVVSGERPWTITTLAVATGAVQGPQYRVDGASAVRVLGWWPSGRPVAVAYAGTSARLLELAPGAGQHELSTVGTEGVDVADDVLAAGEVGPADVPATSVDRLLSGLVIAAAVAGGVALLSGGLGLWLRRRRRSSAEPITG
ncbi:hypothetical protein Acy02nite_57010 [Actinoplanes cyaneus]|uniref:Uncharacterized protein n=1 Tax=Actinoplanes cyaneus TaxID=52696 RepID=A0A919M311_9ACTN|nr:hypothetical protein [Actinoplanes cyaneus]MCW2139886.1 hypothetical protein [Actinoplanes cyaneus]GID67820.1 hypothetical protein Acy02nite_57010 [Actinoplanes cyaneus]